MDDHRLGVDTGDSVNVVQKALKKVEDPRLIQAFLIAVAKGDDPYMATAARLLLQAIAGDLPEPYMGPPAHSPDRPLPLGYPL